MENSKMGAMGAQLLPAHAGSTRKGTQKLRSGSH